MLIKYEATLRCLFYFSNSTFLAILDNNKIQKRLLFIKKHPANTNGGEPLKTPEDFNVSA